MEPSISKLVENFVTQYRKPFSLDVICQMIGKSRKQVHPVLTRLLFKGRITSIEPGIYVTRRDEQVNNSTLNSCMNFRFNVATGKSVLDILDRSRITNVRDLGKAMKVSRQYAYLYLVALASIGAVDFVDGCYVDTKQGDIMSLGCKIDRGILGRLRKRRSDILSLESRSDILSLDKGIVSG